MIPAIRAIIASFLQRVLCQSSTDRAHLCAWKGTLHHENLGTILQSRFNSSHGRILHLFSKQPSVPVMNHFILDSDKVIII